MGMRIQKVMGFGLDDLETTERGTITDYRISDSFKYLNTVEGHDLLDSKYTSEAYEAFIQQKKKEMPPTLFFPRYDEFPNWITPNECVSYESEFGLSNVIVLTPPEKFPRWKRRNDDIDWADEVSDIKTEVKVLKDRGAPGYDQFKWDPLMKLILLQHSTPIREFRKADWWVPYDVSLLCEFMNIFEDPCHIQTLKPMLYTYWA